MPAKESNPILSALAPLFGDTCILLSEQQARSLMARAVNISHESAVAASLKAAAEREAAKIMDGDVEPSGYERVGGKIACIPIVGILTKAPTWYDDYLGLCPTAAKMQDLMTAIADPEVTAIILDIDSPGGFVNGTVELADAIAAANGVKPITAVIRGMCCSGAYWIASQCSKIISRRECEVGNIGVYSVLADVSRFYSEIGVDLTVIASGRFKGMGADGKVTDDLKDDTRRIINGLYQQFITAVSAGRKIDFAEAMELSDGRAFLGPQAKTLGLVDDVVVSFDAAVQSVIGGTTLGKEAHMASQDTKTPPAATANAAVAPPKAGDDEMNEPTTNETARTQLNACINSANGHKDQARATMDACHSMSEEPDDETKAMGSQCVSALRTSATESGRAADAWSEKLGLDPDDDDSNNDPDSDENDADPEQDNSASAKTCKPAAGAATAPPSAAIGVGDFLAAFGDVGARWHYEGKSFAAATSEFITKMKADHKVEIDALKSENAKLKGDANLLRGNEPASFSAEQRKNEGKSAPDDKLKQKMGSDSAAAYVAGIANSPVLSKGK